MKLTSLLLVETLSHSDYVMVNVSNINCTDNVVSANSSQRQLIERCIVSQPDASVGINLNATCQQINR